MDLDIDVSGEDLLSKNYTICVANKEVIKGYKFSENVVKHLSDGFNKGRYRYNKSKKGSVILKIRLYSLVLYYLIKSLKQKKTIVDIMQRFYRQGAGY
jgi:hypothetical protein